MTKAKLLEIINQAMPYSDQITDWELDIEDKLCFTWRRHTFSVSLDFETYEIEGDFAVGNDRALLVKSLLKRVYLAELYKGSAND